MSLVVPIVVSALSGGLAGAVAANWFTIWRDKSARKRTFRSFIKSVRAELLAINLTSKDHRLVERHQETIRGVRSACCDVSDDIPGPEFERVWVDYCGLTEPDIAQREGDTDKSISVVDEPFRAFTPYYDRGRDKMIALLDRMIEYAE